jgi:hypothetical protein
MFLLFCWVHSFVVVDLVVVFLVMYGVGAAGGAPASSRTMVHHYGWKSRIIVLLVSVNSSMRGVEIWQIQFVLD